jgi:hypothetical protein
MLIVTGSGRSGTSAVAKLLHDAGLSAGRDLIAADEGNAEGYYEERALINLNQHILDACHLGERFATATRAEVLASAEAWAADMRTLAVEATPAWKDPRFSWTLEAWLPLPPALPRVIVCLRSPAEVAASVMHYYGLVDDEARRSIEHAWRAQYERLLEVIADYRLGATCVEYGALHADTAATVAALSRFVGRALDPSAVRRDLRHHDSPVPAHLRDIYERVRALSPGEAATRSGAAPSTSTPSRL